MEVIRELIEEKVDELCALIKKFDGSKSDAAAYACHEIVTWAAYNHFEGVGILTEALFNWRNISIEVLEEENADCICDECKEKAKEDIEKNLKDLS